MIYFDRTVCGDFVKAVEKEWLETNGLGGYASSTIIGVNTRGYHGLLVAANQPPSDRILMLSKLEESVIIDNRRHEISCNQYIRIIHPEGYKYLESFRLDPFPVFTYVIEDSVIEKSIFMVYEKNTTLITYRLINSPREVILEFRPLVACRDFHSRIHENADFNTEIRHGKDFISIAPYGIELFLSVGVGHRPASFEKNGYWYKDFEYSVEAQRGQESQEDLYSPGHFACMLKQGEEAFVIASTEEPSIYEPDDLHNQELDRRRAKNEPEPIATIMTAADQFLVKGQDRFSIIAGYHWFGNWGRDTMISLPGLTLVTGKFNFARKILEIYARYCDRGMIPNRFPEIGGKAEYNTVDASLWFVYAVKKFLDYTDDLRFIESELFYALTQIIEHYRGGTRYNIHADTDGLIYAGEQGTQLTWMDAKVGDLVVTPRYGKAVEINALWYNALCIMEELSRRLEHPESVRKYSEMADKVRLSFNKTFWNEAERCLYDCVKDGQPDDSIRPNQIFAVSLPYQLLTKERAKSVLDVVQRELLTPFGLRSLSPKDRNYIGHYGGDQYSRDTAYHQGTVWAWLLGHFITAYVKVRGQSKETRDFVEGLLSKIMNEHIMEAGLGTISEIFDGDLPHQPRGCIAQAWSVAEILRAYVEDVRGYIPRIQRKQMI